MGYSHVTKPLKFKQITTAHIVTVLLDALKSKILIKFALQQLKSKTPQGIEPCPDYVRSATTGVFCFLLLL